MECVMLMGRGKDLLRERMVGSYGLSTTQCGEGGRAAVLVTTQFR